jgi:hypothetical protein
MSFGGTGFICCLMSLFLRFFWDKRHFNIQISEYSQKLSKGQDFFRQFSAWLETRFSPHEPRGSAQTSLNDDYL